MDFSSWLDADRGRLTALAMHFGLTQSAVSQWRAKGVPPARMKAVRDFSAGAVTLDEMLPGQVTAAVPQVGAGAADRPSGDPSMWPLPTDRCVLPRLAAVAEARDAV